MINQLILFQTKHLKLFDKFKQTKNKETKTASIKLNINFENV